jgi:hypothetical protein
VAADLGRLAEAGPWDAVIDTSSADFPPRTVLAGARALAPVARRYVYLSTVNAYKGWPNEPLTEASETLDAPADAGEEFGRSGTPAAYYGTQKAGSEQAVQEAFGPERSVILRPGVILGPGEYVGRLPWWPGYASNARVLQWIVRRLDGEVPARSTPAGLVPEAGDLGTEGLSLGEDDLTRLLAVEPREWRREAEHIAEYLTGLGGQVPTELWEQHQALLRRVGCLPGAVDRPR